MSEVLIDDLNLNKIAHSIRRKNGLVRTYKPREMAPAILAFRNFVPSPHEYNVIVNQTPHQRIIVKRVLQPNRNDYTGTFAVAEPYYTLEISIEADAGYTAGDLICENPIVLDRDLIISATPASPNDSSQERIIWTNGAGYNGGVMSSGAGEIYLYDNPDCTGGKIGKSTLSGTVRLFATSNANFVVGGSFLFGCANGNGGDRIARSVKEVILQNIDSSDFNTIYDAFDNCVDLRKIDFGLSWNMGNVRNMKNCFRNCSSLISLNIAYWDTSSLIDATTMFEGCSSLKSLDLSGWNTPVLTEYGGMFNGCNAMETLDMSNWNTSSMNQGTLNLPSNLRFLIMDKNEVKFTGLCKCNKPNNYIKYLVPSDMVLEYKEHPDWSGRASNIFSIDDFTIVKFDGQVLVSPND